MSRIGPTKKKSYVTGYFTVTYEISYFIFVMFSPMPGHILDESAVRLWGGVVGQGFTQSE
jgi:hypothetical protein